jgi:hypothetical protein
VSGFAAGANDANVLRRQVWTAITAGTNVNIQGTTPTALARDIVSNVKDFIV